MQHHHSIIYRPRGGDPLMGVKLYVEVLDHWQDAGLTRGERDDLMIIAENANDHSRETYGSIHEDYILRRAGKQAQSWRNSIDVLKRKGVLEYAVDAAGRQISGRPGRCAKYRIRILCPEAPHDGYHGQCTRKERVTPQSTHSEWVTGESTHMGTPGEYPSNHLGTPGDAEWVTGDSTPTPPNPSNKNSPQEPPPPAPGPVHPDWYPAEAEGVGVQGEGEGWKTSDDGKEAASQVVDSVADDPLMHQAVLFVDKLPFNARPTALERADLVHCASAWLAKGWSHEALMAKCDVGLEGVHKRIGVWRHRLDPRLIIKEPAPATGHQTYQDPHASKYGSPKGAHRAFQNPTDPDAYEGTF